MKKIVSILALSAIIWTATAADPNAKHDWSKLHGKWVLTHIMVGEDYVDVSMFPYSELFGTVTADVAADGTFKAASNMYGSGSGTYRINGDKVDCYYRDKLMGTVTVSELSDSHAAGEAVSNGATYKFKCRRATAEDEVKPVPQKTENPLSKLIPMLMNNK